MKRAAIEKIRVWIFSLQGKFFIVASLCIIIFTTIGSFIIISREEKLYHQDIENQGKVLAEISRLMLTNVMVYKELGIMDKQDLADFLDYFIIDFMRRDKRVKYIAVIDNNDKVIAGSDITQSGALYKMPDGIRSPGVNETTIIQGTFENEPVINILTPLNIDTKSWGSLNIILSTKKIEEAITALKREIMLLTFLFSFISLAVVTIGARVLSKPVTRLSRIMDRIETHGDLAESNIDMKERKDEIGKLQNSFLWMMHRLTDADREHKKTVEVLCQTEKMVSVGRLASGVAHEINNPLSGITLCFNNLMDAEPDSQTKEKLVAAINDGLEKIKNIVQQLLDFSRTTVTQRTMTSVHDLIGQVLVLLRFPASKMDIRIVNDLSEDIPDIMIDENKMSQVLMNIMINAMQSMSGGGTLTLRTRRDESYCIVSIEDTGIGISQEVLPNIFDPFFTTKEIGEGTGLGLSVSKGIVEQHGGIIEVESETGRGTTFKIKLPVATNGGSGDGKSG